MSRFRRALYDRRISQEVMGEDLGEEFAGYVSPAYSPANHNRSSDESFYFRYSEFPVGMTNKVLP